MMKRTLLVSALFAAALACKPKLDEAVKEPVEVKTEVLPAAPAAPAPAVKKAKKHLKKKAVVAPPCVQPAAEVK